MSEEVEPYCRCGHAWNVHVESPVSSQCVWEFCTCPEFVPSREVSEFLLGDLP